MTIKCYSSFPLRTFRMLHAGKGQGQRAWGLGARLMRCSRFNGLQQQQPWCVVSNSTLMAVPTCIKSASSLQESLRTMTIICKQMIDCHAHWAAATVLQSVMSCWIYKYSCNRTVERIHRSLPANGRRWCQRLSRFLLRMHWGLA